ncbi:MAG TPA: malate synthase A [Myxococcaceae bacterium]|nr:malate synthase A [Myxococcaceae bacterium]
MQQGVEVEQVAGVMLRGPKGVDTREVLTPEAARFLAELERTFGPARNALLQHRKAAQEAQDASDVPLLDFKPETRHIRESDWKIAPVPETLLRRAVEITGPADPKMIINALNSGADVFMADFEDSLSPTWEAVIEGQRALMGAVRRTLTFSSPDGSKQYRLGDSLATLFVRPRGWHLAEEHLWVDGAPMSASLFDFGLFAFHNLREQVQRGQPPAFYLPKMEGHLEARLWNAVFEHVQDRLDIPRGTIKATCLIETLPAAFEMDEILYELREHSAGLNCGRWDYIFSFIKTHAALPDAILPDRSRVTMDRGFLSAYSQLLIRTCHRRGAFAMGGMSAFIPVKDDAERNEAAFAEVHADKAREAKNGHDGTWVAHPALVPVAREAFSAHMKGDNQLHVLREDVQVGREQLLKVPEGPCTVDGLRLNLRVGLRYLDAWLRGRGAVPLYNLMEDAATAEISRAQVWQQLHHGVKLEGLGTLTVTELERLLDEEIEGLREAFPKAYRDQTFEAARRIFLSLVSSSRFEPFLTLPAYRELSQAN